MHAEPQEQHRWLERMVGDWDVEYEYRMAPDQPLMKNTGSETVRSLGGLWVIAEAEGETPDGSASRTIMTLGYDSQQGKFVGTFVASMMTYLWTYEGTLDTAADRLPLDAEGPDFSGGEGMAQYQDVIEFVSDDERTMTSYHIGGNGERTHFMTATYRRRT